MIQNMSTILFFCLSVVAVQVLVSADGMLALARSPELDAAIRSNTLKDFAVQQTVDERERRRLQMPESEEPALSLTYFSVSEIKVEKSFVRRQHNEKRILSFLTADFSSSLGL